MRARAVLLALVLVAPASARAAPTRYVALGDSVAAMQGGYPGVLAPRLGVDQLVNVAVSGATSASLVSSGQLVQGVAAIEDPDTDTQVVTVDIGGNDFLNHTCGTATWNTPACPLADNLATTLVRLRAVLDRDPGDERLLVMGYYNPWTGTGLPDEADTEVGFAGTDGRVDATGSGTAWGMSDVIGWVACRFGGVLADVHPAFARGGQAFMGSDRTHPNAAGQSAIADVFANPSLGTPTPACADAPPVAPVIEGRTGRRLTVRVEPRLQFLTLRAWSGTRPAGPPVSIIGAAGARDVTLRLRRGRTSDVRVVAVNPSGMSVASADRRSHKPSSVRPG